MNCETCNKLSCLDCVGELEKQLAQANADNERITKLLCQEVHFDKDDVGLKVTGGGAMLFMTYLVDLFKANGGENFLTIALEGDGHKYAVTIQNCDGVLTPTEKLSQLEAENAALKADIEEWRHSQDMSFKAVEEADKEVKKCKKALELACEHLANDNEGTCPADYITYDGSLCAAKYPCSGKQKECWKEYYLQQSKPGDRP